MCGQFSIGFIDFMLSNNKIADFNDFFSLEIFYKKNKIILKYCQEFDTKNLFSDIMLQLNAIELTNIFVVL